MDLRARLDDMLPRRFSPPSAIVLHLGGNDMVALGRKDLFELVVSEAAWLAARFPTAVIGWSQVIPRCQWRGAQSVAAVNHSVHRLNKKVAKLFTTSRLRSIPQGCISGDRYFLKDGVHLTAEGNKLLVGNWRAWIDKLH